jgi:hypothetical protein
LNIEKLKIALNSKIKLLGIEEELAWEQQGENLLIMLPKTYPDSEAYVLCINQ